MDSKPQWMIDHEESDDRQFKAIELRDVAQEKKLDEILEIVSAFKLGGRGVMWVMGFLVAVGSIILLIMKIFFIKP